MLRSRVSLLAISVVAVLFFAGSASAADSIWWSSFNAGVFSHATLTGGSGTNLLPAPEHPNGPLGSVVDSAQGRIYWANYNNDTIGYSNLDGSGAATLNTGTATVSGPSGVAIDAVGGKLFWTNYTGDKISWATFESGVGGDIPVPPADVDGPEGIAVDPYNNFIYWANHDGGSIGFSEFDGRIAGTLPIGGVPIVHPTGVAIDPEAGLVNPLETARIYWADEGAGGIFSAALAGGVAERIKTGAGNDTEPAYPFLFEAPKESPRFSNPRVPEVRLGQTLSCGTQSIWRPDLPESLSFARRRASATNGPRAAWRFPAPPA